MFALRGCRSAWLPVFVACAALWTALPSRCRADTDRARPNIVLMLVDELGTGDVPWTDREIVAPTIKALGEGGLRLGTSYAWDWCAPTRGALLSGRFPMHTGYAGGGMPGDGQGMPLEVPLLPNELKRAGYATHMLGYVELERVSHAPCRCQAMLRWSGACLCACVLARRRRKQTLAAE